MSSLKPGWKMVKFGEVVKNANLVERDPAANGVDRIVGLEHIDPENLHLRRWNSIADDISFTRKFVPGQTLFGKRRAYQRKVAYAEFEGICSGDILTFEPKTERFCCRNFCRLSARARLFSIMRLTPRPDRCRREPVGRH